MNPATTPKSKEERAAIFAKLFANQVPADRPKPSLFEQLEEYREDITARRQEGFSIRQIAKTLGQEPIGIRVPMIKLKIFLGEGSRAHQKKTAKKPLILRPIVPIEPPPSRSRK